MVWEIEGYELELTRDGDSFLLIHPKWSIEGIGQTPIAAEADLRHSAWILFDMMGHWPDLSSEAMDMMAFCEKVMLT